MIITREMEDARARLEAYRDKIQCYPPYPSEESAPSPEVRGKYYVSLWVDKKSLELDRRLVLVENTLREHFRKPKEKFTVKE